MVFRGRTQTWRLRAGLCKFAGAKYFVKYQKFGKRTDLKLGELSPLSIPYNITISQLYPLNGFRVIFYA